MLIEASIAIFLPETELDVQVNTELISKSTRLRVTKSISKSHMNDSEQLIPE